MKIRKRSWRSSRIFLGARLNLLHAMCSSSSVSLPLGSEELVGFILGLSRDFVKILALVWCRTQSTDRFSPIRCHMNPRYYPRPLQHCILVLQGLLPRTKATFNAQASGLAPFVYHTLATHLDGLGGGGGVEEFIDGVLAITGLT